ncbi:DUF4153 domain-containing protein [Kitasatospora sp. NPDC056138]|uniref:DUF4153 domain-containing protein n=1 Tax=Kitasatospora sp. NPDC056138 TaxID=3345724 RepID=UPI0035DD83FE
MIVIDVRGGVMPEQPTHSVPPPAGTGAATAQPAALVSGPARPGAAWPSGGYHPYQPWVPVRAPWLRATDAAKPAAPPLAVLWSALGAGLLTAALFADGLGAGALVCALAVAVGAGAAAHRAGRRLRPWTVVWSVAALVLLAVPALTDADWPTALALVAAVGSASLALHGGRRWAGVLFGAVGFAEYWIDAVPWLLGALRGRSLPARQRWLPAVRAVGLAAVLLVVFGALFASADAAMGELLGGLVPPLDVSGLPVRAVLFVLGAFGALVVARAAAAPRRWDRLPVKRGRERGRVEWAVPLVALIVLFAGFAAVQAAVLVGGYRRFVRTPGISAADYARQGFWQLLWVTVLTLVVVGLAKRWAPRSSARDVLLVKGVLGLLCALTLVVVASAVRRMQLYVDAFGLTRLRLSVVWAECWLGSVFLILLVAAVLGSVRRLPRVLVLSAVVAVAAFGLIRPDAVIADQQVDRFHRTGRIDLAYLRELSTDAVPALDRLPVDQRLCALEPTVRRLSTDPAPWYAISLSESRARDLLRSGTASAGEVGAACTRSGLDESSRY